MIPDYPWFGPQHGGAWGWTPITWEGKVLTFVIGALLIVAALKFGRSRKTFYILSGGIAFLIIAAAITGTAPGSQP